MKRTSWLTVLLLTLVSAATLTFIASNGAVVDTAAPAIMPLATTASSFTTTVTISQTDSYVISFLSSRNASISTSTSGMTPTSTTLQVFGVADVYTFTYAVVGIIVLIVVSVGFFFALRRRGRKGALRHVSVAPISSPGAAGGIGSETAEKLQKLRRWLDLGLIAQEDYEDQRKRLCAG